MAEVTQTPTPGVGTGILMPVLEHRWRFMLHSKNKDNVFALARNVVRVNVNYVADEMEVEVEENIKGETSDVVYELVKAFNFKCSVEMLDGNEHVPFSNEFTGCNVVEHSVRYDYALSGIVTHKMKIHFKDLSLMVPADPAP